MLKVNVVIPTLNEERELGATLAGLATQDSRSVETVVVDGGSTDGTVALARAAGIRVVTSVRGRAVQMNAGARATSGDAIVFLHADTRFGPEHLSTVRRILADPGVAGASFPIHLDAPGWLFRLTERAANLRTRIDGLPYGDQAIFCRRVAYEEAGGIPEIAILEDVAFGRRLRQQGRVLFLAGPPVVTSARRWREQGWLRAQLLSWTTRFGYELGADPERLSAWYRGASREAL